MFGKIHHYSNILLVLERFSDFSRHVHGTLNSPDRIGITKGKLSGLHTNIYWRFNAQNHPSLEAGQSTLIVTE